MEKPKLNISRKIELGYSDLHGRGVFATADIAKGEIVERAPFVVMDFRMKYHKDNKIWEYMFTHTCPCDECKKHGGHFLMVLGYAQLYNHQDKNSAEITFDLKNQIADIIAVRDIKKSEEIFINYGPKYFKNKKKIDVDFEEEQSEEIEPHQVEKTKVQNISPAIFMETPVVNNDKKVYRPL